MKSDKEILSGIEQRLFDEGVGELSDKMCIRDRNTYFRSSKDKEING